MKWLAAKNYLRGSMQLEKRVRLGKRRISTLVRGVACGEALIIDRSSLPSLEKSEQNPGSVWRDSVVIGV